MPRLFSAYVIVDWSAASKPTTGADSIWIGVLKRDVRFRLAFESFNEATRASAEARLNTILADLKKRSEREMSPFVYAGAALLRPELFKDAPDGAFSLTTLFDRAAEAGRLHGLRLEGVWMHVGTPDAIAAAEAAFIAATR